MIALDIVTSYWLLEPYDESLEFEGRKSFRDLFTVTVVISM